MTNQPPRFEWSEVESEAVYWYWHLQDPDLSESDWQRWQQWHAIDAHREAFHSVAADWEQWRRRPWISSVAPATKPDSADCNAQLAASLEPVDPEVSAQIHERACLVSKQAAYWYFLCVDDTSTLHPNRRAFLAWMRRSPENIAELLKVVHLDGKLLRLKLAMRCRGANQSNVVDLASFGSAHGSHRPSNEANECKATQPIRNRPALLFKLVAFSASLIVGVTLAFIAQEYTGPERIITTGASQWQHMTLPDGTAMHVDARSKVKVDYTDEARIVHVYKGSAVFDVAKDPRRPFIARTHLVDATAVGTRFGITIDPGVTTTVSQGSVKVTRRGHTDSAAVMLKPGEELRVSDPLLTSPSLAHVDAERKLQWTNGLLIVSGMTVSEGVREFNRRNRVQIVVESPALGEKVVKFASVDVDSPDAYARIIAAEPGVTMTVDKENDLIRLSE